MKKSSFNKYSVVVFLHKDHEKDKEDDQPFPSIRYCVGLPLLVNASLATQKEDSEIFDREIQFLKTLYIQTQVRLSLSLSLSLSTHTHLRRILCLK